MDPWQSPTGDNLARRDCVRMPFESFRGSAKHVKRSSVRLHKRAIDICGNAHALWASTRRIHFSWDGETAGTGVGWKREGSSSMASAATC